MSPTGHDLAILLAHLEVSMSQVHAIDSVLFAKFPPAKPEVQRECITELLSHVDTQLNLLEKISTLLAEEVQ